MNDAHDATRGPQRPDPDHPDQLGPFAIEAVLGRGAFGTVYRAIDTRSERTVALKVLHVGNLSPFTIRRLDAEAEALRSLEDDAFPWFPRVVDTGRVDGVPFLAMEHVAGGRIDAFCDARRLDLGGRVALFRLVCLAIQRAHQHGILHLDLKPAHVLVQADGDPQGGPAPRVIDLGLAQGIDRALVLDESTYATPLGTPGFISPEVVAGRKGDARSDVYALGVMLYWLVSGTTPWDVDAGGAAPAHRPDQLLPHPAARWRGIAEQDPARAAELAALRGETPAALHRQLAGDLGTIVARAVAPDPKRRYQDPGELADDLARYLGHRPIEGRRERFYRARLFVRRHRVGVGVGTGAMVALVALIGLASSNLALARANLEKERELLRQNQRVSSSLVMSGDAAAQRGRWNEALDYYRQAAEKGYPNRLDLGVREVTAYEACFQLNEARSILAGLFALPEAEERRAKLLLLEGDLGASRFDAPEAGLISVREAVRLAELDAKALSPAELGYAKSLLAQTPSEALAHLRNAHALDGSNHRVNTSYAMTMLLMGNRDNAGPFAEVFRALSPDDEEAMYLSIALLALTDRPQGVADGIAQVATRFGPEAGELGRQIAATFDLIPWANDVVRANFTSNELGLGHTLRTIGTLLGKVLPLQRAITERSEQWTDQGHHTPLVKVPPSVAARYRPLIEVANQRPFRPQAIASALAGLRPEDVDGMLILIHAMGLVQVGDHRGALARVDETLRAHSFLLERRTALLFGCLLGAQARAVLPAADAAGRAEIAAITTPWLTEAIWQNDWTPPELVKLHAAAVVLGARELADLAARKAHVSFPDDFHLRILYAETLLADGAVARAETLTRELEAEQSTADADSLACLGRLRRHLDAALAGSAIPAAPVLEKGK